MALIDHSRTNDHSALNDLLEVTHRIGDRLARDDVSRSIARTTLMRWAAGDPLLLQQAARIEYRNGDEMLSDLLAECAAMLQSGSVTLDDPVELDLDAWLGR